MHIDEGDIVLFEELRKDCHRNTSLRSRIVCFIIRGGECKFLYKNHILFVKFMFCNFAVWHRNLARY